MTDLVLGCYMHDMGTGDGVTVVRLEDDGSLVCVDAPVASVESPSWVTAHPRLRVFYAASESAGGQVVVLRRSSADGFAVAQTRASGGHSPCHVAVSPDARHVAVANYVSGTLAVFALDKGCAVSLS